MGECSIFCDFSKARVDTFNGISGVHNLTNVTTIIEKVVPHELSFVSTRLLLQGKQTIDFKRI